MIQFRVQWPNAGHVLLAGPVIDVLADDASVTAVSQALGRHDFEIPDGTAKVQLLARFTAGLPLFVPENLEPFTVFDASQIYRVEQDALIAETAIITSPDGVDASRTVHPLIQTVSAANALSGVAVAELRTEFLDITAHWFENAPSRESNLNAADTEPDNEFVALAATGVQPPLWFAHFPKGMDPGAPETSVLAFFRPHAHYTYGTAFDLRHFDRGLQDLNRYLLAPKDHEPVELDGVPTTASERFPFADPYYPLRIGWQQAVLRSGKQMVVLHPWPTSGLQFGAALTSALPAVIDQILVFLHGTGRAGASQPHLELGRLGVAGFSAGGPPAVQAMKANRSRVKEMYLFDPFPFLPEMPFVIDWAFKTPDFRLRMTGANFWGQCETVRRAVVAGVSGEAGDLFVTLRPTSLVVFKPENKGGSHYWNYVIHTQPDLQSAPHVHHQFAAFGGDELESDENFDMLSNKTWLEEFLVESAF